jgi:hypothetical protein
MIFPGWGFMALGQEYAKAAQILKEVDLPTAAIRSGAYLVLPASGGHGNPGGEVVLIELSDQTIERTLAVLLAFRPYVASVSNVSENHTTRLVCDQGNLRWVAPKDRTQGYGLQTIAFSPSQTGPDIVRPTIPGGAPFPHGPTPLTVMLGARGGRSFIEVQEGAAPAIKPNDPSVCKLLETAELEESPLFACSATGGQTPADTLRIEGYLRYPELFAAWSTLVYLNAIVGKLP